MDCSYPILCACERGGDRVALIGPGGERVSYRLLEARVAGVAAGLRAQGLAGGRVASLLTNRPETFELYLALARIGAVSVPLNVRLSPPELGYVLDDAGVTALIAEDRWAQEAQRLADAAAGDVEVLLLERAHRGRPGLHALRETPPGPPPVSTDGDDDAPATILYTSGTTGFPKGVVRSHRANTWNMVNSALGAPRAPGDVELFNLPAFGIGFLHFAFAALLGGATVVLDGAFDAQRVWELLERHRVTRTFLAPTMLDALLAVPDHAARDVSSLTVITSAYAFPERLRDRVAERFGDIVVHMYGLTEAQLTSVEAPGRFAAAPTSVGRAMGVSRVAVLDPAGERVPDGTRGEIAFEGPSTMTGYHGRPAETAAVRRGAWLLTGDLGRVDAAGELHYVGRSKEMIKTGGFSVDPVEVEHAILSLDTVAEAAVLGVADDHWGEMVVAFVACAPGAGVEAADVTDACRTRIAAFKVPKDVVFVDALPKNPTGKVERAALRRRYAERRRG